MVSSKQKEAEAIKRKMQRGQIQADVIAIRAKQSGRLTKIEKFIFEKQEKLSRLSNPH